MCPRHSNEPIIFIFDNELASKDKPLKKLVRDFKLDKDRLQREFKLKLTDKLWLVTIDLVAGKEMCEIEDLFTQETLNHKIDGRYFAHVENTGASGYPKEAFAKYIAENYESIDFSGFKCILNNINEVIQSNTLEST